MTREAPNPNACPGCGAVPTEEHAVECPTLADIYARQAADARVLDALLKVGGEVADHQAIIADCLLWFDGFKAAHLGRDDQPRTPDRDGIRRLNAALQAVLRARDPEPEVELPF